MGVTGLLVPRAGAATNGAAVLRVVVIARSMLHREGIRRVLEGHPRLHVVGSAALSQDALAITWRERPDIALIELAGLRDVELARHVAERSTFTKLVGIAESISEDTLVAALESGIVGLIGPDAGVKDLVTTFDAVRRGEFLCSPRTAALLQRRLHHLARARVETTQRRLTPRERDIMLLVGEGLTNGEIAARLCVELSTVKNHLHNIFEKLGVHTRADALKRLSGLRPATGDRPRSAPSST